MRSVGGKGAPEGPPLLPAGYGLDRSDPDVLVLRCPQGVVVARFSARGATAKAIEQDAWRDTENGAAPRESLYRRLQEEFAHGAGKPFPPHLGRLPAAGRSQEANVQVGVAV
jgi:hypothetical protein